MCVGNTNSPSTRSNGGILQEEPPLGICRDGRRSTKSYLASAASTSNRHDPSGMDSSSTASVMRSGQAPSSVVEDRSGTLAMVWRSSYQRAVILRSARAQRKSLAITADLNSAAVHESGLQIGQIPIYPAELSALVLAKQLRRGQGVSIILT